jgi:glycosyltransferase involved in cell wall biosynthesis
VKIVHVIGALVAGGAERFVVSLAKSLQAAGIDVELWALSNRLDAAGASAAAELRAAGIMLDSGPRMKVGWSTIRWYADRLAMRRPAVVHLHTPNTELAHFAASVITLRAYPRGGGVLFRTIHNTALPSTWPVRLAYRRNPAICSIACGEAVRRSYSPFVRGPLVAISNGVDFVQLVANAVCRRKAREALGLEPDAIHYLSVGRMSGRSLADGQKAQDVLVAAWRMSGLGARGAVLHLIGEGNLRDALERAAEGDGSIRFHGVRSDIDLWLAASDCYVMPSRYEGLPIAGIEAIGAGLRCVFSDIPPLRELEPPMAAWFPVDDAQRLAECLTTMLTADEVPPPGPMARFREKYSIARTAERYLEIYRSHAPAL